MSIVDHLKECGQTNHPSAAHQTPVQQTNRTDHCNIPKNTLHVQYGWLICPEGIINPMGGVCDGTK